MSAQDLAALLGDLVTEATGLAKAEDKHKRLQKNVTAVLKGSSNIRSNQFAVRARLAGLVEKHRIFNNDEVADALESRLNKLQTLYSKWAPDVLAFLLEISKRPVQASVIETLELLKRPPSPVPLTWADVLAEDPLDDVSGIWNNVNYAEDGSTDDEDAVATTVFDQQGTPASSLSAEYDELESPDLFDVFQSTLDYKPVKLIQAAESELAVAKTAASGRILIPETLAVRETLFMLLGLSNSLYVFRGENQVEAVESYQVQNLSEETFQSMLGALAAIGAQLMLLRISVKRPERIPLKQRFQAILEARLRDVDAGISNLEGRVINSDGGPLTLLRLSMEIGSLSRTILPLARIIPLYESHRPSKPFDTLEALFEMVCASQAMCDDYEYEYLARIFLECFHIYLQPIRLWMDQGEIDEADEVFFVKRANTDYPASLLWSNQFQLVCDARGSIHAPAFLHLAAKRILTEGKSVKFLSALGQGSRIPPPEYALSFENVCRTQGGQQSLDPFAERFGTAFSMWMSSKQQSTMRLREELENGCDLWRILDALEIVYFSRNGALAHQVSAALFDMIDRGKHVWKDRFILTDLYQRVFGHVTVVDAERMTVRVVEDHQAQQSRQRSIHKLETIRISYALPWPIANLIHSKSLGVYQRIATMLLQLQRAKQLLGHQSFRGTICKDNSVRRETIITISLRHRLSWFTNTLQSYLTTAVLYDASNSLRAQMSQAKDLEDMIAVHQAFIERIERQCLLARTLSSTHQALVSILDLAVLFTDICSQSSAAAHGRKNTRCMQTMPDDDSLSEEDDEEDKQDVPNPIQQRLSAPQTEKLTKLSATFNRLLDLLLAGVREASRVSADSCLEILADDLAFGVKAPPYVT